MGRISIIIPIYKVEQYIQRCVDSVLTQTFTDFETILVDDGTPDFAGGLADEYALEDSRVVTIHKSNGGVSEARNMGIDLATSENLTFIDSDDWIMPQYVKELMNSTAEMVLQTAACVDENNNEIYKLNFNNEMCSNADIERLLLEGRFSWTHCKRVKNSIVQKNRIQFSKDIDFAEDTLFMVQCAKNCKTIAVENVANYKYVHYTSRETLSNNLFDIRRFNMLKKGTFIICSEIYSDEVNIKRLFYKHMQSAYSAILRDLLFRKEKSFFKRYIYWKNLKNDETYQVILSNNPNMIDFHYFQALKSKTSLKLFIICVYAEFKYLLKQIKC